ncbi:MAG: hypothetical protein ABI130_02310, partial [Leifsonia sp.]
MRIRPGEAAHPSLENIVKAPKNIGKYTVGGSAVAAVAAVAAAGILAAVLNATTGSPQIAASTTPSAAHSPAPSGPSIQP